MAIDSTAGLLFEISANADDATENIARFRALMGQNLDGMAAQFSDWSEELLGDISTVSGAMIAMTAGVAAGMLAIGVAVKESTTEYHAYALPKKARAAAITTLETKTGWPRHMFLLEAQRMDIVTSHRRPWTKAEDCTLAAALGELTVHGIAKLLRRTHESVKARAERLQMSIRARSGYCIADLAKILGSPRHRVHEWIEKGLLGTPDELQTALSKSKTRDSHTSSSTTRR